MKPRLPRFRLPRLRWPRFRLRTLLIAVLLLAPSLAWYGHELRKPETPDGYLIANLRREALKQQASLGCLTLLNNLGYDFRDASLPHGGALAKQLAYHGDYRTTKGQRRTVFIYDPPMHSWPGWQPQTIVIADRKHQLIAWEEVGGSPIYGGAELSAGRSGDTQLCLTHSHRNMFKNASKTYYSLEADEIKVVEMEWTDRSGDNPAPDDGWQALRARIRAETLGLPVDESFGSVIFPTNTSF